MGDSSDAPTTREGDGPRPARDTRLLRVRSDGTPVYGYDQRPGVPSIGVVRMGADGHRSGGRESGAPPDRRHIHDFHVLTYVHRGHDTVRVDGADHALRDGDVLGVAPGQAIEAGDALASEHDLAWSLSFLPDVVPALAAVSPLVWNLHPLLRVFSAVDARYGSGPSGQREQDGTTRARPDDGGSAREIASVPGTERERWRGWFEDLTEEVTHPERTGAPEAMVAGLTRILVAAARLTPGPPSPAPDPLLVRVFDQVEAMFRDQVSAGDVARALGYTPGHLTTVVRERSGRTVGEWLGERRLTEARRLLLETDLPLGAIAARTGLADGAYLGRRFRRRYGTSPDRWRRERRGT
ncbi:AraC family transcriptional regulator [Myceligenerans xiligouense]|uniref:AraC family transcriptional regulator n=1 Tax=Myceligenerans xiligouense TaxID=253184 RepID=A0A3N4ZI36_9MICO|nr:AraC family transcriptional regulator [Myceligenerans xiligouense]RPF19561.1 AraC family transcriptional regulator [Myceligenerans xiligouense]